MMARGQVVTVRLDAFVSRHDFRPIIVSCIDSSSSTFYDLISAELPHTHLDQDMAEAGPPLTILVVDDQLDTAEAMAELLRLYGCDAQVASCGADALRAAAVETPDVVLLDIGLPGLNGWEVARRLRDQAVGKQPLVVAVTAHGNEDARLRSADVGIDLHLVKPVSPAVLSSLVARVRSALAPVVLPVPGEHPGIGLAACERQMLAVAAG